MSHRGRSQGTALREMRCLAVVFLLVAVVHSVLAVVEHVPWPAVVACACTAGAMMLERVVVPHLEFEEDAARLIVRSGLADLPDHDLTLAGR